MAALVDGVLRGGPVAVAATKRILHDVPERPFHDALVDMSALSASLFTSDEGREGMHAFLEKRLPRWIPEQP